MKASQSRRKVFPSLALGLLLLLLSAAPAQQKKREGEAARQPLVVKINVSVVDAGNRPIKGLRPEDVQVLEDGVPQKVTSVEPREGPLTYGLLLDNSGSFRELIGKAIGVARVIIGQSEPDAAGFAVRFIASDNIKVVQDITTNKPALLGALEDMFVEGGQSAIGDAVYLAAERLAKFRQSRTGPGRYVIFLLTDGDDRASYYKPEQVFDKLHEADVQVFAVGFVKGAGLKTSAGKATAYINRLAFETGGSARFVEKGTDLSQLAVQLLAEAEANSRIVYTSTNPKRDGSSRKLSVTVSNGPEGAPRTALVRGGYTAPDK
jgi:VWFA-related protein